MSSALVCDLIPDVVMTCFLGEKQSGGKASGGPILITHAGAAFASMRSWI
jgi:hypothetical protein